MIGGGDGTEAEGDEPGYVGVKDAAGEDVGEKVEG